MTRHASPRDLPVRIVLGPAGAYAGTMSAKSSGPPPALDTGARAIEGKASFADQCAPCNGKQLEGMARRSLKGSFLLAESPGHDPGGGVVNVSPNMPVMAPAILEHGQRAKIMSFLLHQTGEPFGTTEPTFDYANASTMPLSALRR